jgi:large subunit ribosomal protein L28
MGRSCELTGKHLQFGHNVAHSNRKTNRRFLPNIQSVSLQSEALGRSVKLSVSTRALRTVQKKGGLDAFLLGTDDHKLPEEALRLKRSVKKAMGRPKARATG